MSQLFAWGGQSSGVSASASVLPMNTQDWPPLGWTGWISLQSKGLSRVLFNNLKCIAIQRLIWNKSFKASIFFPQRTNSINILSKTIHFVPFWNFIYFKYLSYFTLSKADPIGWVHGWMDRGMERWIDWSWVLPLSLSRFTFPLTLVYICKT